MRRPVPAPTRALSSTARSVGLAAAAAVVAVPLLAAPGASAAAPTVSWSDRTVVAGRAMTATVSTASLDGATPVLQRRFPDGWRVADPVARVTSSGLVLDVPTDQYGTFSYRVVASGQGTTSATDPVKVTVSPPYDPVGRASAHSFMTSPRWLWDSCSGPITWKFNPTNAPGQGFEQVAGSFDRIHAATGLDFVYAGTSSETPRASDPGTSGADILVGWRGASSFKAGVVGEGGAAFYRGFRLPNGSNVHKAVEGGVMLNAGFNDRLAGGFGKGYTWGEVVMHELAHVIGLGHVGAKSQVMYHAITGGAARWGAGDLNGFRKVGDTMGCVGGGGARTNGDPVRVRSH
jgi:hypothetical protein